MIPIIITIILVLSFIIGVFDEDPITGAITFIMTLGIFFLVKVEFYDHLKEVKTHAEVVYNNHVYTTDSTVYIKLVELDTIVNFESVEYR